MVGSEEEHEISFSDRDFNEMVQQVSKHEDTQCGFSIVRGKFLQKFASKKLYATMHGLVGCILLAQHTYYNGALTTMEKRYKIPTQNIGIIMGGSSVASCIMTPILTHCLARRHRPRWMAFGVLTIAIYCFMTAALHFMYGPGDDALSLTIEYGASYYRNSTRSEDKTICMANTTEVHNKLSEPNIIPQMYLLGAKIFSGIFSSVFNVLGVTYMDDNMKKSKTPLLISISLCMYLMGTAIGSTIVSFCLSKFIDPNLTPIITPKDSRWLGAWWMGWIIFGVILAIISIPIAMFPKELPRAAARRMIAIAKQKMDMKDMFEYRVKPKPGMFATFKRICTNKIYVLNNISGVFYMLGVLGYWVFTPKYIETQFRQSASFSNFLAGTLALTFSALGIAVSGIVVSKFKPSARTLAAWNVFGECFAILCSISYAYIGCDAIETSVALNQSIGVNSVSCNSNCNCEYVKFSPVCGVNGETYISPCHAGCTKKSFYENGTIFFEKCGCIETQPWENIEGGRAIPGSCLVDCMQPLLIFMIIFCIDKFIGTSGRCGNFLIGVRCVKPEDKAVSMGIERTFQSLFAHLPSPIVFGWIIDQTCTVWGKTSSGTGNCWMYDSKELRYSLNYAAALMFALATLFDCGVWYYVKDLKIFDDVKVTEEMKCLNKNVRENDNN